MGFNANSTFGFGSNGDITGGTVTGANNGLSLVGGITAVLGQNIGEVGNPAALLSNREIPMSTFELHYTGVGGVIGIEGNMAMGIVSGPLYSIHIEKAGSAIGIINTSPIASTAGALVDLYIKPLPTAGSQRLGSVLFGSRNGANDELISAEINAVSAAAWTAGVNMPADMIFRTKGTVNLIERMRIASGGSVGIGVSNPQAAIHIKAGTVSIPPFKLTSGTNSTPAQAGAMEYNGSNLFFTRTGTTRENIWTGNAAAPQPGSAPALAAINNYYGIDDTFYLAEPTNWASVVLNGVEWKVPLYV